MRPVRRAARAAAAAAGAGLLWGHFEAGWVRLESRRVPLPGLPPELEGLRIVHLSDFHLGFPSRGERAVWRAVRWTRRLRPDLVCVTGDVLSHPRASRRLTELLDGLPNCFVILGNHDYAHSRDPFSKPIGEIDVGSGRLLFDESRTIEIRGRQVQIAGVDPRSYLLRRARPETLSDPAADLRILLCHFPAVIDRLPPGAFHLTLAGHMHAGQICVPLPIRGGRLRLSQLNWRYVRGLYRRPGGVLHLSAGLGTTFVPFRFLARPEATELVLESDR